MFDEKPNFKRFMMTELENYFSLSESEQQKLRMEKLDDLEDKADIFFCEKVLKEKYSDDLFEDLVPQDNFRYNIFMSYLRGVGKNHFHLNESFHKGENTSTFNTLYDYDLKEHEFQEKCIAEESENYEIKPYNAMRLYANWARGFVKIPETEGEESFHYMILNSFAAKVYMDIEEIHSDIVDKLVPHELQTKIGKEEDGFSSMEFHYTEKDEKTPLSHKSKYLLDEMKSYGYKLMAEIYDELKIEIEKEQHNSVFVYESEYEKLSDYDPSLTYIFSDINVIKNIRLEHWQEDIEKYYNPDFREIIESKKEKYVGFFISKMNEQFKVLEENYNPKITDLKKGMDIKISSQVKGFLE